MKKNIADKVWKRRLSRYAVLHQPQPGDQLIIGKTHYWVDRNGSLRRTRKVVL